MYYTTVKTGTRDQVAQRNVEGPVKVRRVNRGSAFVDLPDGSQAIIPESGLNSASNDAEKAFNKAKKP